MARATKKDHHRSSTPFARSRKMARESKDTEKPSIKKVAPIIVDSGKTKATMISGECLATMRALPAASIDMVLCDLPYGTTHSPWDVAIPLDELFIEYRRVCKPDCAIVLFGAMPFTADLVNAGRSIFRYSYIWEKNKATGHLNAPKMPLRIHEDILVFYGRQPRYTSQKSTGHRPMNRNYMDLSGALDVSDVYACKARVPNQAGSTERHPTSVLKFPVVNNSDPVRCHPNQKPVDLLRWLIRAYSKPGDVILDNTAGSGSTGEAAMLEGRSFLGIELDADYFGYMVSRLSGVAKSLKESACPRRRRQILKK